MDRGAHGWALWPFICQLREVEVMDVMEDLTAQERFGVMLVLVVK